MSIFLFRNFGKAFPPASAGNAYFLPFLHLMHLISQFEFSGVTNDIIRHFHFILVYFFLWAEHFNNEMHSQYCQQEFHHIPSFVLVDRCRAIKQKARSFFATGLFTISTLYLCRNTFRSSMSCIITRFTNGHKAACILRTILPHSNESPFCSLRKSYMS